MGYKIEGEIMTSYEGNDDAHRQTNHHSNQTIVHK